MTGRRDVDLGTTRTRLRACRHHRPRLCCLHAAQKTLPSAAGERRRLSLTLAIHHLRIRESLLLTPTVRPIEGQVPYRGMEGRMFKGSCQILVVVQGSLARFNAKLPEPSSRLQRRSGRQGGTRHHLCATRQSRRRSKDDEPVTRRSDDASSRFTGPCTECRHRRTYG